MNLKIEALKACIFILIGAYLFSRFQPESNSNQPVISQKQEQSSNCKAVVKTVTAKDGTKTEEMSFEAASEQKQELLAEKPKEKKHSVLLLKDQASYSYKYIQTKVLDLSPLVQARKDQSVHLGIKIDF